jgi:alkyl sulfatase BDS1-like metallo-beta-lactamase superfamily hydrolase
VQKTLGGHAGSLLAERASDSGFGHRTRRPIRTALAAIFAGGIGLCGCVHPSTDPIPIPEPRVDAGFMAYTNANKNSRLVQLSEHVWAAIAFDIGNIGFVVTDEGVFVFDTGGEVERAQQALDALRTVTDQPIVGVAYSHGHGDHTGGIDAFVPASAHAQTSIYANSAYPRYLRESAVPRGLMRAYYQMGYLLPKDETGSVGSGIGPLVGQGRTSYQHPTVEIDDRLELEIGGVRIELFNSPGDLDDGLSLWLPDEKVLMAGDAVYPMMPALATPRFEHGRQSWEALETLDRYRALPIEHLLPGHLRPISGRERVASFLTHFRDLVQYLQDQSIRAVNQRLDADEAARRMEEQLPRHLAEDPDLAERYHEFHWIAKGMYTKAGGWWSGDVVDLIRITPNARAERVIALAGGRHEVRSAAEAAFANGERGWAAELMRMLVAVEPDDQFARRDLARMLRTIAYDAKTSNLRHYLLTEALVMDGVVDLSKLPINLANPDFLAANPDSVLFRAQGTRLDPVSSAGVELVGSFLITDTDEEHTLIVRRGAIEYKRGRPEQHDLRVHFDRATWIQIAGGHLRWLDAEEQQKLTVTPGRSALEHFARHFDDQ